LDTTLARDGCAQNSDLRIRFLAQNVFGVDLSFGPKAGLETHRPWEMLIIAKFVRASRYEQMRHLLLVDIALNRRIGRRAQGVEQQRNLVLLDQSEYLFERLRRTIAVIERDKIDLATGDSTLVVDHLEERKKRDVAIVELAQDESWPRRRQNLLDILLWAFFRDITIKGP
jgi:hypothetical protein